MSQFEDFSIKVRNFKCFGDTLSGFETIKPINPIIGRNNSGKSTLIALIRFAALGNEVFDVLKHYGIQIKNQNLLPNQHSPINM